MCSEGDPDTVNTIHTAAPLPPKNHLGERACDPDTVSMAHSLRVIGHYYPTDVTSPGAGSSQRAQWAWPQHPVPPYRTAASFLRDLAALTGGRYHCPVGEDSLLEMQGLLTRGFIHQRVGCRAAG